MAQRKYTTKEGIVITGDSSFGGDIYVTGNLILKDGARIATSQPLVSDYVQFFNDVDLVNHRIMNVGSPIIATDAANVDYVLKKVGAVLTSAPTEHLQILNDIEFALRTGLVNGTSIALSSKADVLYADNLLTAIQDEAVTRTQNITASNAGYTYQRITEAQERINALTPTFDSFDEKVSIFNVISSSMTDGLAGNEAIYLDRAKYFVDGQINQLLGYPAENLDTLSELAQALTSLETNVNDVIVAELATKKSKSAFDGQLALLADSSTTIQWTGVNFVTDVASNWTVNEMKADEFIGDGSLLTGLVSPDELPAILNAIANIEALMDNLEEKLSILAPNVTADQSSALAGRPMIYLDAGLSTSYPGAGAKWYDLTSRDNDIRLSNVGFDATAYNGMMTFDGVNSFGAFYTTTLPSGNSEISIEAAFIYEEGGVHDMIFTYGSDSAQQANPTLWITAEGKVSFEFGSGAGKVDTTTVLTPGVPYHVVAVYDKTSGSTRIYLNGVLEAETTYNSANIILSNTIGGEFGGFQGSIGQKFSTAGNIGTNPGPAGYGRFKGKIGLLRFYDNVLIESSVEYNYNILNEIYNFGVAPQAPAPTTVASGIVDVGNMATFVSGDPAYNNHTLLNAMRDTETGDTLTALVPAKYVGGNSQGTYTEVIDAGAGREFVVGNLEVSAYTAAAFYPTDPFVMYVSDDNATWTEIGSLATSTTAEYPATTVTLNGTGRYLKVVITGTNTGEGDTYPRISIHRVTNPWDISIRE